MKGRRQEVGPLLTVVSWILHLLRKSAAFFGSHEPDQLPRLTPAVDSISWVLLCDNCPGEPAVRINGPC